MERFMAGDKRMVVLLDCFGFHPRNDEQPSLQAVPTPSLRAAGEAIQKTQNE